MLLWFMGSEGEFRCERVKVSTYPNLQRFNGHYLAYDKSPRIKSRPMWYPKSTRMVTSRLIPDTGLIHSDLTVEGIGLKICSTFKFSECRELLKSGGRGKRVTVFRQSEVS